MINRFNPQGDRAAPMLHIVSYHNVPMPRGNAYAVWACEQRGAKVDVYSCVRVDAVIAEHNRLFHTNLHGQQYLIDMHAKDPAHFAAANPLKQTSHCFYSDGHAFYGVPAGHPIPYLMVGMDLDDHGKYEDNTHFAGVAHGLGLQWVGLYKVGNERHHGSFGPNLIPVLEHHGIIDRNRHA